MIASRPFSGHLAALAAAGAVTLTSFAHAGTCGTDADCGTGLACRVIGMTSCVAISCPANSECPPPPDCNPTEIKECVPAACSAASDCPDDMVCYEAKSTVCEATSAGCAPGQACDPPPPDSTSCTTTSQKLCVPRYLLPCVTTADCGAGFDCVLDSPSCGCAGSGGTGFAMDGGTAALPTEPAPAPAPSGSGDVPPAASTSGSAPEEPLPPGCSCTPATTNHCELKVVDCTSSTDCPSGWTCSDVSHGDVACGAPVLPDGGIGQTMCDPVPPSTKQCVPPYFDVFGRASDHGGVFGSGAELPLGSSESGTAGASNGAAAPKANGVASSGDNGGCQVGHGGSSTGTSLLALVGLIGLARRKRS